MSGADRMQAQRSGESSASNRHEEAQKTMNEKKNAMARVLDHALALGRMKPAKGTLDSALKVSAPLRQSGLPAGTTVADGTSISIKGGGHVQ